MSPDKMNSNKKENKENKTVPTIVGITMAFFSMNRLLRGKIMVGNSPYHWISYDEFLGSCIL